MPYLICLPPPDYRYNYFVFQFLSSSDVPSCTTAIFPTCCYYCKLVYAVCFQPAPYPYQRKSGIELATLCLIYASALI